MIIDITLKSVAPFVPVARSAYRFAKTCVRVYSASSFSRALIAGAKGIIIDCTPPVIKYSLLCAGALACGEAACIIGNPNFVVDAFEYYSAIVGG
jgi:hypothetical protein